MLSNWTELYLLPLVAVTTIVNNPAASVEVSIIVPFVAKALSAKHLISNWTTYPNNASDP